MKKIQDIKYPEITSYVSIAHLFSIIGINYQANHWIYDNFINLFCPAFTELNTKSEFKFAGVNMKYDCPVLTFRSVHMSYLKELNIDIIDAIKAAINTQAYVFCNYDQYHIPYSINFKQNHYEHQCLIYGYDDEKQILNFADFLRDSKYEFVEVSYDDFRKAFTNYQLELVYWPQYCCTEYNKTLLLNNIDDFLNSTYTVALNTKPHSSFDEQLILNNKMVFGLNCYDVLVQALSSQCEAKPNLQIWLHVLFDHKVLMVKRISHMFYMNYMKKVESLLNDFICLRDMALMSRNMFMKYIATNNGEITKKLIEHIKAIKIKDQVSMVKFRSLIL